MFEVSVDTGTRADDSFDLKTDWRPARCYDLAGTEFGP